MAEKKNKRIVNPKKRGRPPTKNYDSKIVVNLRQADKDLIGRGYSLFCQRKGGITPGGGARCVNDWTRAQLLLAAKAEVKRHG